MCFSFFSLLHVLQSQLQSLSQVLVSFRYYTSQIVYFRVAINVLVSFRYYIVSIWYNNNDFCFSFFSLLLMLVLLVLLHRFLVLVSFRYYYLVNKLCGTNFQKVLVSFRYYPNLPLIPTPLLRVLVSFRYYILLLLSFCQHFSSFSFFSLLPLLALLCIHSSLF